MLDEHGFRIVDNTVEADAAAPRICLNFSDQLAAGRDYSDFVSVEGGTNFAIEPQRPADLRRRRRARPPLSPDARGRACPPPTARDAAEERRARHLRARPRALRRLSRHCLCAAGRRRAVHPDRHGQHRQGQGEDLPDRRPSARRRHPRRLVPAASSPIGQRRRHRGRRPARRSGKARSTSAASSTANVTTAIPVGEVQPKLKPGAYVTDRRRRSTSAEEWAPKATQWFIVTDLGLTTLSGNDGVHAMVRSLATAGPVAGVQASACRHQQRGARRGDDRRRPATPVSTPACPRHRRHGAGTLVAPDGRRRLRFLDLSARPSTSPTAASRAARPPKPLDVFLTTERGIYRAGETVYADRARPRCDAPTRSTNCR